MDSNMEWICPHPYCDSKTYSTHLIQKAAGGSIRILKLYTCDGCSRVFSDPDKFNIITDMDYDKRSRETLKKHENEREGNK